MIKLKEAFAIWSRKFQALNKADRPLIIAGLAVFITLVVWASSPSNKATAVEVPETEIGKIIPDGFVIVPLQMKNSEVIESMFTTYAVIDVLLDGQKFPLAKNLRVIRIPHKEESVIGGLVPEEVSLKAQEYFSRKGLNGVLKKLSKEKTEFHFPEHGRRTPVYEVFISEEK